MNEDTTEYIPIDDGIKMWTESLNFCCLLKFDYIYILS